jgi:hypothetical protein
MWHVNPLLGNDGEISYHTTVEGNGSTDTNAIIEYFMPPLSKN